MSWLILWGQAVCSRSALCARACCTYTDMRWGVSRRPMIGTQTSYVRACSNWCGYAVCCGLAVLTVELSQHPRPAGGSVLNKALSASGAVLLWGGQLEWRGANLYSITLPAVMVPGRSHRLLVPFPRGPIIIIIHSIIRDTKPTVYKCIYTHTPYSGLSPEGNKAREVPAGYTVFQPKFKPTRPGYKKNAQTHQTSL